MAIFSAEDAVLIRGKIAVIPESAFGLRDKASDLEKLNDVKKIEKPKIQLERKPFFGAEL